MTPPSGAAKTAGYRDMSSATKTNIVRVLCNSPSFTGVAQLADIKEMYFPHAGRICPVLESLSAIEHPPVSSLFVHLGTGSISAIDFHQPLPSDISYVTSITDTRANEHNNR